MILKVKLAGYGNMRKIKWSKPSNWKWVVSDLHVTQLAEEEAANNMADLVHRKGVGHLDLVLANPILLRRNGPRIPLSIVLVTVLAAHFLARSQVVHLAFAEGEVSSIPERVGACWSNSPEFVTTLSKINKSKPCGLKHLGKHLD